MKRIFILLLISWLIICPASFAQWVQTNGPNGGIIKSLLLTETIFLAGTDGNGIYLSTNKGKSWSPANNGLTAIQLMILLLSVRIFLLVRTGVSFFPRITVQIGQQSITASLQIQSDVLLHLGQIYMPELPMVFFVLPTMEQIGQN